MENRLVKSRPPSEKFAIEPAQKVIVVSLIRPEVQVKQKGEYTISLNS